MCDKTDQLTQHNTCFAERSSLCYGPWSGCIGGMGGAVPSVPMVLIIHGGKWRQAAKTAFGPGLGRMIPSARSWRSRPLAGGRGGRVDRTKQLPRFLADAISIDARINVLLIIAGGSGIRRGQIETSVRSATIVRPENPGIESALRRSTPHDSDVFPRPHLGKAVRFSARAEIRHPQRSREKDDKRGREREGAGVKGGAKEPARWPPSNTFAWLLDDRRHRRANLRWIARAIRDGWLMGSRHARRRTGLRKALNRLERSKLTERESIALIRVYLAMSGLLSDRVDRLC